MNPVLKAIADGHFIKSKGSKIGDEMEGVCRKDAEIWPCSVIVKARLQNSRNVAATPA